MPTCNRLAVSYKDSTCKPSSSTFIRRGKAHQKDRLDRPNTTKIDGTEPDRLDKRSRLIGDFHHEEYNLATNST